MYAFPILLPILAALFVDASKLALQTPHVVVATPDGNELLSEQIPLTRPLASAVTLGASETLKFTFQVVESESEKGVQPHQAFLRFFDETTGEEGIQPIKVGSNGKAKFELNMARPPTSLPPSGDAPLQVSLLLGSFVHEPAKYELFDLAIPPSHPPAQHAEEVTFHPLPEIVHTFRPDHKVPPVTLSALFGGLVVAPWIVLFGLWGTVQARVPRLFSPNILPFTFSLAALEGLLLWYWVELRLGQVLLYGAGLSVFAMFTGKHALASIATRRISPK